VAHRGIFFDELFQRNPQAPAPQRISLLVQGTSPAVSRTLRTRWPRPDGNRPQKLLRRIPARAIRRHGRQHMTQGPPTPPPRRHHCCSQWELDDLWEDRASAFHRGRPPARRPFFRGQRRTGGIARRNPDGAGMAVGAKHTGSNQHSPVLAALSKSSKRRIAGVPRGVNTEIPHAPRSQRATEGEKHQRDGCA